MAIRLDMIGLVTKDLARSLDFYRTLGLDIPAKVDLEEPYFEITLDSGVRLSWNKIEMIKQIDPEYVDPVGQGIGIAYLCDSPADVDARYNAVVAAGFDGHKEPWDAFWGQRYAQVKDPDGYLLDLFAPLG